ncbi:MAG: hypothetical protein KatS3mg077_2227 [Candidatus Binatia bacterium]|nr:MAG: hypothetical protein KatS3mg077_2227 [Candidatus Binatia bacterium]
MLHQRAASSRTRKFVRGGLFLLLQCSWALPTEAGAAPRLQVGSVQAQPGWVVELPVTLATAGAPVAAVSQNLFFDPRNTPIVQRAPGEPDCWVEPSTGKQGFFAFWPDGCWQWPETCDMVSAVILSFQSTQPIPDGRLFTCRVKVSPNAAAGEYAVASDYADAASPDASELALEHFGGAIQVVNPSGGGGGGCSIATRGDGSWLLLAALLWFGWRHKGRAKSYRRWRWALVALALSLPALVLFRAKAQVSPASPPTTRVLEIGGSLRPAGLEGSGTFQGEIALFSNGGISGSVEVEVGGRKETLNISAALSGGRIRGGRAWAPHGRIRAVLAGQVSAEAGGSLRKPSGSLRWRDGSRYLWELEEIRVLGKQAAREVVEALGRGERPTVALYLDTYPVDREIRLRFRDKTSPAWVRAADREAAFKLKRSLSSAYRAQVINELGKLGVTVPSISSAETVRTYVPAVLESFQQLQAVLALPSIVAVQIPPDERGFRIEPLLNESLPLIRQPEVAGRLRGGS